MKFLFSFFLCIFLFSCQQTTPKKATHIPFLPNEATAIIKIKDLSKARSLLQNNALLQQNKTNLLYSFFKDLSTFQLLTAKKEGFYLCFSPLGKNDFGFSLITENNSTGLTSNLIEKHLIATKTYNDFSYTELKLGTETLYATLLKDTWILTSDYLLMENHIKQFQNDIVYKYPKAIESLSDEAIALILINSQIKDISQRLFPSLPTAHLFNEYLTGWTAGEITIDKNSIDYTAIYKPTSKTNDVSLIFKNILPQNNRLAEVTPSNAIAFTSFTFESYTQLAANISKYRESFTSKEKINDFLVELTEFGGIQLLKNDLFACRVPNESIDLSSYFDTETNPENFRDFSIYKLKENLDFGTLLQPLHSQNGYQFYIKHNEFIIFSPTKAGLIELIPSLKSNNTLANKEWYKKFSNQLTQQSSMLNVVNSAYASIKLNKVIAKEYQKNWEQTSFKNYNALAFQLVTENNFSHLHLTTTKTPKTQSDFKVNENANLILDVSLKSNPQWVTNYISKTKEVLVQDVKNNLILISKDGEVKWKKELKEPVLGEIKQMDIYRNGRLQYIFTTPTHLYVLDRNGKEVAPYPLNFSSKITQPVALFDYDNNKKYRIVITQSTQLKMFDNNGKQVKGFRFKNKSNGIITHAPKHIRVGKKDYIVVNESNTGVHFLNRTGKNRIALKENAPETTKEWFWYNNTFTTLNIENTITHIKTDGTLHTENPVLKNISASETAIDATTKTWISFYENELNIKKKTIELEFGRYSKPKIFYIKNKIYVTITNLDTKKVYLFDSNAKSINGFPVYGTGAAIVENADKDSNLELVVQGDQKSLLFYEFR